MGHINIFLMMLGLILYNPAQSGDGASDCMRQQKMIAMVGFVRSDPVLGVYSNACPASVDKTGTSRARGSSLHIKPAPVHLPSAKAEMKKHALTRRSS